MIVCGRWGGIQRLLAEDKAAGGCDRRLVSATPPPEPLPRAPERAHVDAQVLTAQQARIAGELNDIVAHAVSALSICAGVAERQLDRNDGPARESLRRVRAIAGEAMADLRRLQALLNDGPPAYAPQPGLEELEELAAAARQRGIAVEIVVDGKRSAVTPSVAVSVHRIVEAALADLRPGAPATVVGVEAGSCAVVLTMRRPTAAVLDDARERVRLHGGSLEQGAGDVVTVTLPL